MPRASDTAWKREEREEREQREESEEREREEREQREQSEACSCPSDQSYFRHLLVCISAD